MSKLKKRITRHVKQEFICLLWIAILGIAAVIKMRVAEMPFVVLWGIVFFLAAISIIFKIKEITDIVEK